MDVGVHPDIAARVDPTLQAWVAERYPVALAPALEFFRRFYHEPLSRRVRLDTADAAECACGSGLNALAFLLAGGRSVVGYDKTETRVDFAQQLAARLGLADRARFEVRDIHELPETPVDVVFTLQTLEHVPRPLEALRGMGRRARRAVVLSTPNLWWPKDGHDTGLMFAHWAPRELRRRYARLRRARVDQLCRFLSPREIEQALPEFERVTSFYNFDAPAEWTARFPTFFPYGRGGGRFLAARGHRLRWRAADRAFRMWPRVARDLAPMNEGIYLRRAAPKR
jgi:ubiquinone/menaquinone biosynthesis C-methylase UbiE